MDLSSETSVPCSVWGGLVNLNKLKNLDIWLGAGVP